MARKVQDVINRVREVLQDEEAARYKDEQLIAHLMDALLAVRSIRPDLFIGAYSQPLPDTLVLTDVLPCPDWLFAAIAYYVAGAAEMRDDEFALDNRAMTLQQTLTKKLVTGMV
jgi:hypothetical protein